MSECVRAIKEGILYPIHVFRRHHAHSELVRMLAHGDPKLRAVGTALQEVIDGKFSDQEQEIIDAIELRRDALLHSDKEIDYVDYGAGSSDRGRTMEEMDHGVESVVRVDSISNASKPLFWAEILFKLIRHLQPQSCLELGTCVGICLLYTSPSPRDS